MAIPTVGGRRALAGGLLLLVLVATGAMPAAAGGPGPGSGPKGRPAGAQSRETSPRPARHHAAGPRTSKPSAAAPDKPSAAPDKPSTAPNRPKPTENKPEHKDRAQQPEQKPDHAKPRRDEPKPFPVRPRAEVRSSTVSAARPPVSRVDRPRPARAIDRPAAAVVSAADPSTALFTPPPVVEIQAAAVELEPRRFWPRLPGAAGHPAFPGLLAAVLLGFIALGFRGDRRDPKLAAAAIDDRDDRAEFR